ncbi:MAG: hypothetical protein AAB612_02500 [Patescibacteria group bacterium]
MGYNSKLRKIERMTKNIQLKEDWTRHCVPISISPDYVPQYNDSGELLPPPILGGLSMTPTPYK